MSSMRGECALSLTVNWLASRRCIHECRCSVKSRWRITFTWWALWTYCRAVQVEFAQQSSIQCLWYSGIIPLIQKWRVCDSVSGPILNKIAVGPGGRAHLVNRIYVERYAEGHYGFQNKEMSDSVKSKCFPHAEDGGNNQPFLLSTISHIFQLGSDGGEINSRFIEVGRRGVLLYWIPILHTIQEMEYNYII